MRDIQHPAATEITLTAVLHALSDPVRLQIVRELDRRGEEACSALGIPVSKATLSHHFKVLRDAGVITTRAVGTARVSTLRRAELEERFPGLLDVVLRAELTPV
jgi:DNA-binding transcriptional ArsR family regulator